MKTTHTLTITTPDDLLLAVLHSLRSVWNLQQDTAFQVLLWMCTKADAEGHVVVVFSEYSEALGLSQQSFHNNIKILKNLGLLEGSRGVFKLHRQVPYWITDRHKNVIVNFNFHKLPPHE